MKKIILILVVVVVVGAAAWGMWFFVFSKNPSGAVPSGQTGSLPPVQIKTQSGTSVPVQNIPSPQNSEVAKDFLSGIQNADQIALGGTVIASPYALQVWGDANKGGEALLEYSSSAGWTLVSLGGGEWTVLSLLQEGVPVAAAEQLVAGLGSGTPTPVNTSTFPTGATITIGTPSGVVTMNNFYHAAAYVDQDEQVVVVQQTSAYGIFYNRSNSSFTLTLFGIPSEAARQAAEIGFLAQLGISQSDACKLTVYEDAADNTSSYSGQLAGLSFCGGTAVAP